MKTSGVNRLFELTDEELRCLQKELDAIKSKSIDDNSISSCDHLWFNTGLTIQGESLMVCSICRITRHVRDANEA
jgi:hypothetical protein